MEYLIDVFSTVYQMTNQYGYRSTITYINNTCK